VPAPDIWRALLWFKNALAIVISISHSRQIGLTSAVEDGGACWMLAPYLTSFSGVNQSKVSMLNGVSRLLHGGFCRICDYLGIAPKCQRRDTAKLTPRWKMVIGQKDRSSKWCAPNRAAVDRLPRKTTERWSRRIDKTSSRDP
jgi:hypothetical protein